ncbi:MAG: LacI family DNA-binding transcriptional regulator [Lentisphaeria bacterium]|nr:LacI family DNA-binding transcriptional regulator [Lentisphaeria bacterium]
MKKNITLSEIAKRAGVNASTVSRVLHAKKGSTISSAVREKIIKICNELNYRPNTAARSIVTGRTYRVGFILGRIQNDLSSPVFGTIIKGLCGRLQERNYTLSILWAEKPGSSRNDQVSEFLMSEAADCYVLTPAMIDTSIETTIKARNKPIIYLAENIENIPTGISGVQLSTVKACEELLEKIPECWKGKILYTGIPSSGKKLKDLQKAMGNLGWDESAIQVELYTPSQLNFAFDRWAASEFARENIDLLLKQKLIWCASDLTALGIADVLQEKGIKPGKDIALIGYDNIEQLVPFNGTPFLTTINPCQEELGIMTADMALEAIEGISDTTRFLEANVIFRDSFRIS